MAGGGERPAWGGGVIAVLKSKGSHNFETYVPGLSTDLPQRLLARPRIPTIELPELRPLPVAAAIILIAIILLNLFWVIDHPASPTDLGTLKDLGSFLHSGSAHRLGLNPYEYHPGVEPLPISREGLNLNPPISVYAFDFLSRFDPSAVKVGFIVVSCLAYFGAVYALMRAYPEKRTLLVTLAVLALAGFWHMLWYLQLYAPLLLGVVAAWLLIRRGQMVWAGVCIGLVIALKPNYAVVPLILLAAGHYRIAIPAVAAAAAVSVVPLVLDGPDIYRQWLELSINFPGVTWTSNASLASAGARLGVPVVGTLLAAALFVSVLYVTWRIKPGPHNAMACGLLTVLLLGPVSWAGYTLFLLPFLFSRKWDRVTWAAVFLLAAPFSPNDSVVAMSRTSSELGLSIPQVRTLYETAAGAASWLAEAGNGLATGTAEPMRWLWNAPWQLASQVVSSVEPFTSAVLASIYVWAVLVLLVRFIWEQTREQPAVIPYRPAAGSLRRLP